MQPLEGLQPEPRLIRCAAWTGPEQPRPTTQPVQWMKPT
jgi:hypothetical protein